MISEKKMQIVIDNYFKSECNVDTSIRDAFEKGFRIGVQKTSNRPTGRWIDYSDEGYVECPFCHSATNCDGNKDELHFCFSCGAKMEGGAK